jgi:hypothetical protein
MSQQIACLRRIKEDDFLFRPPRYAVGLACSSEQQKGASIAGQTWRRIPVRLSVKLSPVYLPMLTASGKPV